MKWISILLICLFFSGCIRKEKECSTIFTNKLINQWEIATVDTINSIIERNRYNKTDTFELKLLCFYYDRLFNHRARLCLLKILRRTQHF